MAISATLAQHILFSARMLFISRKEASCSPGDRFSVGWLSDLFEEFGAEVLIPAPAYALDVFRSFSPTNLIKIQELYCSRELRGWQIVARIMNCTRQRQGLSLLSEEGIWATCVFMNVLRSRRTVVSVDLLKNEKWDITTIQPALTIQEDGNASISPVITCVINRHLDTVIGFSIDDIKNGTLGINRAIYQALISGRTPSFDAAAGVLWSLPQEIVSDVELPPESVRLFTEQGVLITRGEIRGQIADSLRCDWYRDLRFKNISIQHFHGVFDNYLEQFHSHAPLLDLDLFASQHKTQIGFNRDPLWQFPALRDLFPKVAALIDDQGYAHLGYQKYYSDELLCWLNETVFLTISPFDATRAWVFASDGQVICQATLE